MPTRDQSYNLPLLLDFCFMVLHCTERVMIFKWFCLWARRVVFLAFLNVSSALLHLLNDILNACRLLLIVDFFWILTCFVLLTILLCVNHGLTILFLFFFLFCGFRGLFFLFDLRSWFFLLGLDSLYVVSNRCKIFFIWAIICANVSFDTIGSLLKAKRIDHNFVSVDICAFEHAMQGSCACQRLQIDWLKTGDDFKRAEKECSALQLQWWVV